MKFFFPSRSYLSVFCLFSKMSFSSHRCLIEPTEQGLLEGAKLLREGGLLAFPTETVYGLGANALNEQAVLDIFKAKGRPLTDPLIVHVSEPSEANDLVEMTESESKIFKSLTDSFWPGPLTIIVKASKKIPLTVTANTGFVGVRCPNHSLARKLIHLAQVPIAAPSANRFGHVSPTRAVHVLDDLKDKGIHVLNGESDVAGAESCGFGIESTVIKLDQSNSQISIFRQGAITQQQIENILRIENIPWNVVNVNRTVKMHGSLESQNENVISQKTEVGQEAPGQAVTHYAPDVPCYIIESMLSSTSSISQKQSLLPENSESFDLTLSSQELSHDVVLIDFAAQYHHLANKVLAYRDLSINKDPNEAAQLLFETLRWAEQIPNARKVLISKVNDPQVPKIIIFENQHDLTLGVADRIFRAASGIHVNINLVD